MDEFTKTYSDLGYDRLLRKVTDDIVPEPGLENYETSGISNPTLLGAGTVATQLEIGETADNYMQSSGFSSGSSGWRIDGNGDVEFNSGTFRGTLEAGSIHIPDEDTTANSFHVESDGDAFWGCTQSDFTADNDNANAYILKTGVFKFQSGTISGGANVSFISDTLDTSAKNILSDFTFSPSDYSGGLKTGDITWNTSTGAITGGSGGVFSKYGIVFATSGTPTITLDGTTGAATFAGALSAASGTFAGTVQVGGTFGSTSVATIETQANSYFPSDENLVGYWDFDEGTGTTAYDNSGNGGNGTLEGNPSYSSDGISGHCIDFDGTGDYVSSSMTFPTGSFSLSVWANWNSSGTSARGIISMDKSEAGENPMFVLGREGTYGKWNFTIVNTDNTAFSVLGDLTVNDTWVNIAAVYDDSDKSLKIYQNGVLKDSDTLTGTRATATGSLYVGLERYNLGVGSYWYGKLDEPRIYSKALSQEEVYALYKNPTGIKGQGLLIADKIRSGTLTAANHIALGAAITPADANDTFIADTKTQASDTTLGWWLGRDNSDSDKAKFNIGDANASFDWGVTTAGAATVSGSTGSISVTASAITVNDNVVVGSTQGTSALYVEDGANKIYQLLGYTATQPTTLGCATSCDDYVYILNTGRIIERYKITGGGHMTWYPGSTSNTYWKDLSGTYNVASGLSRLGSYLYCHATKTVGGTFHVLRIAISDGTVTEMTISGTAPSSSSNHLTAADGTSLYVSKDATTVGTDVYKYSISDSTATYVSTITMPANIEVIGCDGTYFYMTEDTTDTYYQTDLTGSSQDQQKMPSDNFYIAWFVQNNVLQSVEQNVDGGGSDQLFTITPFGV